jgi:dTDP-L-rhamnose 4-epimerase
MAKRALITGGAGFVGSHLADALLASGFAVRVLDNLTDQVHQGQLPEYLSPEVEFIRGDVRDRRALVRALRDVDAIYHFAAAVGVGQSMYEIGRYMDVNTLGAAELLQVMLEEKIAPQKLVVASSMSIYGEGLYACATCGPSAPRLRSMEQLREGKWDLVCPTCGGPLAPRATPENKPSEATSVYAISKRDQEDLCLLFGRTYNVPVVALRFFNIYGPRQALSNPYTGVAAIFASRLLNRQAPLVFEDGEQRRDFVSVHDVVQANLLALERPEADGEAINIGSGDPVTIRKVAEILAECLGVEIAPQITGASRAGDIRHCYADLTKARRLLGYEPKVSREEGFSELAAWLGSQQAEDRAEIAASELEAFGLSSRA